MILADRAHIPLSRRVIREGAQTAKHRLVAPEIPGTKDKTSEYPNSARDIRVAPVESAHFASGGAADVARTAAVTAE